MELAHNQLSNVRAFMTLMGQTVRQHPPERLLDMPTQERVLRARLILEEALECVNALGFEVIDIETFNTIHAADKECERNHYNFVHENPDEQLPLELSFRDSLTPNAATLLDGLVDLDYVGHKGTALAFGLQDLLQEAERRVHDSNMSKLWTLRQINDAGDTLDDREHDVSQVGLGKFVVRRKDGKVVKPPTFKAPDMKGLVTNALKLART